MKGDTVRDVIFILVVLFISALLTYGCQVLRGEHGSSPMNEDGFWALIDEIHEETQFDYKRKELLLQKRLRALNPQDLEALCRHWEVADGRIHQGLWAAAYAIHGGCGDDGFMDFRSTLIMCGRKIYMDALDDPDSLVTAAKAAGGDLRFENFRYSVSSIADERLGEEPPRLAEVEPHPAASKWADWEEEDLPQLLPRIWAEFGQ